MGGKGAIAVMKSRSLQTSLFAIVFLTVSGAVCQTGSQGSPAASVHQHMSPEQQAKLLDEYCSDCHNDDIKSGSMTLTAIDPKHPEKNAALAEQIIRKVGVGMMPPPGKRRPDGDTLKMFSASLAADVDMYAAAHPSFNNPPLHRLNRTEYANSIRSLLDVDINPETLLPSDAMSHGFDNMADALTLSPALMEAYVRAGGKISREAIGDKHASPLTATYSVPRVVSQTQHVDRYAVWDAGRHVGGAQFSGGRALQLQGELLLFSRRPAFRRQCRDEQGPAG